MMRRIVRFVDAHVRLVFAMSVAGLLLAGLWPLDPFPRNGVSWLPEEAGLRFREGVVVAAGPLQTGPGEACSIEILIESAENRGASTILDLYDEGASASLALRTNGNAGLEVIRSEGSGQSAFRADHRFLPGERTLITLTSDAGGATVYIDGERIVQSTRLNRFRRDCSGSLVLGTSASSRVTWHGDLLGLAIYSGTLLPGIVADRYEEWSRAGWVAPGSSEGVRALYSFDERSGNEIRNRIDGAPALLIPTRFRIPFRPVLKIPSPEDFGRDRINRRDLIVNLGGFVPFGFVMVGFLRSIGRRNHAALVAIAVGFALSLSIESLQWFIPIRASSLTDVAANFSGTILGVVIDRFLAR
jgi:hypothetical protein